MASTNTPEHEPPQVRAHVPIVEPVMVKGPNGPMPVHPQLVENLPHIFVPVDETPNPETNGAEAPAKPATGENKEA